MKNCLNKNCTLTIKDQGNLKNEAIIYRFLLIILVGILLFPAFSQAQEQTLTVGTATRKMIVHAPSGIETDRPLVISMHGMNQTMYDQKNQTQFISVADANNFLLVFPQAVNNQWQLWGTQDVDFILAIIDEMYKKYGIDRDRVYLSGFSMGGMMTYYAATKIADKIAAYAPVSGFLMDGPNTNSSRPVPILHIHGADDNYVPHSNVQTHLKAWAKRNGCSETAQVTSPYPADKLTSKSVMYYWSPGKEGVEVMFISVAGVGHWYSDDPNGTFSSQEIWNFCKKYSLKAGVPELKYAYVADNTPDKVQIIMTESILDAAGFTGFKVKADGQELTINSVVKADSNKLVITLSNNIVNSNAISLSYSNGNVLSVFNKKLADFNDALIDNLLKGASPRLTDIFTTNGGDSIVIKFNKKMQIPSDLSALTLNADYNGQISIPFLPGSFFKKDSAILSFPLDKKVYRDYSLLLSYSGNNILSADGSVLKTITDYLVTNNSNGLPVHLNSGKIEPDGITLSLHFSKPMVLEGGQANSFILEINGKRASFTGYTIVKDTIKFTLSASVHFDDIAEISYNPGTVKAADNGPLEGTTKLSVENKVVEPTWTGIPGKIEAENYSSQLGIQTENTSDTGGGLNVGWFNNGDWLEYPIENNTAKTNYQITFRVSAPSAGAVISFYIDGKSVGNISVPATGNWQIYNSVDANISIGPGKHYLKIVATTAGFNLNYMDFHEVLTEMRKLTETNLNVFPNPASTEIFINADDFRHNQVEIFNTAGTLLISKATAGETIVRLPLQLVSGMYLVKITNEKEYKVKKIEISNN